MKLYVKIIVKLSESPMSSILVKGNKWNMVNNKFLLSANLWDFWK